MTNKQLNKVEQAPSAPTGGGNDVESGSPRRVGTTRETPVLNKWQCLGVVLVLIVAIVLILVLLVFNDRTHDTCHGAHGLGAVSRKSALVVHGSTRRANPDPDIVDWTCLHSADPYFRPVVWYTFQGNGMALRVSVSNEGHYDFWVAVYGGNCANLENVYGMTDNEGNMFGPCPNTVGNSKNSYAFQSEEGKTYYVVISGCPCWPDGQPCDCPDDFTLEVSPIEVARNDLCENAVELPLNVREVQHVKSATWDPVYPAPICHERRAGYDMNCWPDWELWDTIRNAPPGVWYSVQSTTTAMQIHLETLRTEDQGDYSPYIGVGVYNGTCGQLSGLAAWEFPEGECLSGRRVSFEPKVSQPGLCISFDSKVGKHYYIYVVSLTSDWRNENMEGWAFAITASAL